MLKIFGKCIPARSQSWLRSSCISTQSLRTISLGVQASGKKEYKFNIKDEDLGSLRPLYLDAQATTPLDPRVLDRMMPYMTNWYGNPHSRTHFYGWETENAVETASDQRDQMESALESHLLATYMLNS